MRKDTENTAESEAPTREEWMERCKRDALARVGRATNREQVYDAWHEFARAMRSKEYTADGFWLWFGDALVRDGSLGTVAEMRNFIEGEW